MDARTFLTTVITAPEGWFNLCIGPQDSSGWIEEWYRWPDELDKIVQRAEHLSPEFNIYFSSYLFASPQSTKDNVLPSRTIQADLDEADVTQLPVVPSILVQSSPNRHQGYWILKDQLDPEAHEVLSRKITYAIPHCDHSGWALGRKVRIPDTLNHKYLDGPKPVQVVGTSLKYYNSSDLELLPDAPHINGSVDESWIESEHPDLDIGPHELLETLKRVIPAKVYSSYGVRAQDRSAALWSLMCAAFRAGLDRDKVYYLALHSANNKFADLRTNGARELSKDVLRAEQVVKSKVVDVRSAIMQARQLSGLSIERRSTILSIVLAAMKDSGEFIRTSDDNIWYVRRDLGRPILITRRSEYLDMVLDLQFGLNPTEIEQSFVVAGLANYARSLPATAVTGSLSYYDEEANAILLHTGKKDVIRITTASVETVTNGSFGVVFPWITSNEPFKVSTNGVPNDWAREAFGSALNNVIGIESEEALTLLRVWSVFLLFRNRAVSRPVLALFGQPGAGKSTLFRRIYCLIYGRSRGLGAVTTPDDYDHASSVDPLLVLDNVDTWERWLPDRLALSASTSDITKRKLYTDLDTVTMKRQALVGITAHNPRFGREDVADRLLLLNFERLSHFLPEGDILDRIQQRRPQLWGAVIQDVQKVLCTPIPNAADVPQFRIEDFARIGWRIATALDCCSAFASALKKVYIGQRMFSLEEEHILVSAMQNLVRHQKSTDIWYNATQLWSQLETNAQDAPVFQKTYRNAVYLSKKLWALQESLKELFSISWRYDVERQARVWNITGKS